MTSTTFMVTAERCPHVLCRLLGLLAQQNLMIGQCSAMDTQDGLNVSISIPCIDQHRMAIIASKMREMVRIRTVDLI